MLGAFGSSYSSPQKWAFSTSWRYFKSDRHYVGSEFQGERDEEGSQVVNRVNIAELSLKYNVDDRWSVTVGVPYLINERSNPLRDEDDKVVARSETHATGLGDISLIGRRWMLKPSSHPNTNFSLGLGAKFPTGDKGVLDTRTRLTDGEFVKSVEPVDQSIQPGDGGFGAILDAAWFYRLAEGRVTFYSGATYLFNPSGTNGVATNRGRPAEAIMSVPDAYVARVGTSFTGPGWHGWSVGIGGRLEGQPWEDVFGPSDGFRRPGYTISVEPSVAWSKGPNTIAASVPIVEYANRTRNFSDRQEEGRHGDAAFASWIAMVSYTRRFGPRVGPSLPDEKASSYEDFVGEREPFDVALCNQPAFRAKMADFESTLHSFR